MEYVKKERVVKCVRKGRLELFSKGPKSQSEEGLPLEVTHHEGSLLKKCHTKIFTFLENLFGQVCGIEG